MQELLDDQYMQPILSKHGHICMCLYNSCLAAPDVNSPHVEGFMHPAFELFRISCCY